MNLLVDIGNSRLKWACEFENYFVAQMTLSYQHHHWKNQLLKAWENLAAPEKMVISSVAFPEILSIVQNVAKQLWSACEMIIPRSMPSGLGVKNAYQYPEKLGIDRWLCLIAARHFYPQMAVWIVDCGTAMTLDFMDENGIHHGGLIAPGLTLMKKSLTQNTAALNFSAQTYSLKLADMTEAAIFSGTLYAAIGLVEQALKTQIDSAVLLLTGGDAPLISPHLSQSCVLETDLVLKGLSIFSHSNDL